MGFGGLVFVGAAGIEGFKASSRAASSKLTTAEFVAITRVPCMACSPAARADRTLGDVDNRTTADVIMTTATIINARADDRAPPDSAGIPVRLDLLSFFMSDYSLIVFPQPL
jgi:hypothetical protein